MDKKSTEDRLKEFAKGVTDVAEPVIRDLKTKAAPAAEVVKKRSEKATRVAKAVGKDITNVAARHRCKEEVFIQYNSHEIRATDLVEKAKRDFVNRGSNISDIKEIQVYIKPSDNAAYYVINHSETGRVDF